MMMMSELLRLLRLVFYVMSGGVRFSWFLLNGL